MVRLCPAPANDGHTPTRHPNPNPNLEPNQTDAYLVAVPSGGYAWKYSRSCAGTSSDVWTFAKHGGFTAAQYGSIRHNLQCDFTRDTS